MKTTLEGRCRAARKKAGFGSQEAFAEELGRLGVKGYSGRTVRRIESLKDEAQPGADYLVALIELSGEDAHYLLTGNRGRGAGDQLLELVERVWGSSPPDRAATKDRLGVCLDLLAARGGK